MYNYSIYIYGYILSVLDSLNNYFISKIDQYPSAAKRAINEFRGLVTHPYTAFILVFASFMLIPVAGNFIGLCIFFSEMLAISTLVAHLELIFNGIVASPILVIDGLQSLKNHMVDGFQLLKSKFNSTFSKNEAPVELNPGIQTNNAPVEPDAGIQRKDILVYSNPIHAGSTVPTIDLFAGSSADVNSRYLEHDVKETLIEAPKADKKEDSSRRGYFSRSSVRNHGQDRKHKGRSGCDDDDNHDNMHAL